MQETILQHGRVLFLAAVMFATIFLFGVPQHVYSATATLQFSPSSGSFEVGKDLTVKVQSSSDGPVNSSEGVVTFDTNAFKVRSISTAGSAFNLWTEEPADPAGANSTGEISYGGGGTASFSGVKTLFSITFTPKKEGETSISIRDGKVLAADGKGTDVLESVSDATFSISPAKEVVIEKPTPPPTRPSTQIPTVNVPVPGSPQIESSTHVSGEWSNKTVAQFSWDIAMGILGVRTLVDDQPDSKPTETFEPPVTDASAEVEEGVSYFHVAFKNRSGWGESTHFELRIDTTPPPDFTVVVTDEDPLYFEPVFAFEFSTTTDSGSGISHVEVVVDFDSPIKLTLNEIADTGGSYQLPLQDSGLHTVSVRLFDTAGNFVEKEVEFETATLEIVEEEESDGGASAGIMYWVSLLAVAFAVFAFGMMYYERRKAVQEREYIKREADEVRVKLEGIFNVLRDEVEEQVVALATKPNMTESERQVLEKLKEALEISEELLDKEIEDVRKLLS